MSECKLVISKGVAALIAGAHNPTPPGVFYFGGDMCQMAAAADVARELGFAVGIGGGIPYVRSKRDYEEVVSHLRTHRINGYWNYN